MLQDDRSGERRLFQQFVASSAFTTNVDFEKVAAYDHAGGVIDARSYHVMRVGGDLAQGLAAFAKAQGSYLSRREAFEDLWAHGRRFVYGAVNAAGMGAEDFGPICLVLPDPEKRQPDALGVFPQDTVKRYTDAGGKVETQRAHAEATAWEVRSELALIERGLDAEAFPAAEWPHLLCRKDEYLEVVLAGTLPLEALAEARLRADLRRRLDDLRARWLVGDSLTSVEENEAEGYDALQRWRRHGGIAINDIP